ncbi:hypothetical protein FHE72_23660 (plasmid) [Rossellomorea vietnamensis]|uniref:Uncharacterized protein n=1 Tax=Rossellomorea vietnamensis TaxID=218284 RepID=A0A6I6UW39_9BACI|nr:hypothetical protein [Rossellomorea vietnamensis]QHE63991.1 hypothetical protein FHE72_23660 [Rossellomorea vietnamensis]
MTYSMEWGNDTLQLAENNPVYCESAMFSGPGVIDNIFPEEYFGIQVLMNEPDPDGHRLKRFAREEVKSLDEHPSDQPVLSPGVKMVARAAGEPIGHIKTGEQYLIQVSTYSKNPQQVNIYDPHTERHLGGCSKIHFQDIREYDKSEFSPKDRTKPEKKKNVQLEQLSFDF